MRNLITATEVIELAFAENSNMREESISATSIHIAEIKYIRPVFGDMYALLSDKYADYTNDYVKPALAYFVKCEIVSSIAIDMSNSGIAIANPQYQSAASDKQRQRLYDSEMSKAKTLLDFALEYIAAHSSEFPDFRGNAPKKHHRVAGLILGNGPSVKPSSISGEAYKGEIDRLNERIDDLEERIDNIGGGSDSDNNYTDADKALVQTIPNKADKSGNYPNMTVGKAQGVVGISQVQEALTVETKPNGNIVIGNLAGRSKEFMPATPSGAPMHYAYEAAGAVWNANTGYWELNGGEFDNDTIGLAYWRGNQRIFPLSSVIQYLSYPLVTNFPAQNVALNSYEKRLMMGDLATNNSKLERVRFTTNTYDVFVGDLNYAFYGCSNLIAIEDILNIGFAENVNSETFAYCTSLVEVRLKGLRSDISFADSPLSVESATYMIANANASSSFAITFRADRQAIFEANSDFIAAKSAKPNITILYQ